MKEKMICCDCPDIDMSGRSITIRIQCGEDGKLSACIVDTDCCDDKAEDSSTDGCCD